MSDKPASLLTKRQRDRVDGDFESVTGAKRRRERQRVRKRIVAGAEDFRHLTDYPDNELRAAFELLEDDDVITTLADARLFTERVRLLHGITETELTDRARTRRDRIDGGPQSLSRADPGQHTTNPADDEGTARSAWDRRSETALKLGAALALPGVSLVPVPFGVVPPAVDGVLAFVALAFGSPLIAFGLLVLLAQAVKYDVVPAVRAFSAAPRETLEHVWSRF